MKAKNLFGNELGYCDIVFAMQKTVLEEIYRKHHERGSRYGYLYCHGARSPYLKNWIDTGLRSRK
jgi:hypothetical protein